MTLSEGLLVAWVLCLVVPLAWWLRQRRQVDVWAALPMSAALLNRQGQVVARTGPGPGSGSDPKLALAGPPPPAGTVLRTTTTEGCPVLVRGLPTGGLAVEWPESTDALEQARARLGGELTLRLAHDLSTPLMAVRAHLELVTHEPIGPVASRSLDLAVAEVDRLMTLTRDLATLTGLRAGAAAFSTELAGLLAEEAVTGLLAHADARGAAVSIATPAEPLRVSVMSGAVIRALRNLVGNALDHGLGERGAVVVTVAQVPAAERVRFSVRDSGPGLPPDELARLTAPLVRGGSSIGTGLGLAIVAEVLAAHGSTLVSCPTEAGGEVWFDLPVAAK